MDTLPLHQFENFSKRIEAMALMVDASGSIKVPAGDLLVIMLGARSVWKGSVLLRQVTEKHLPSDSIIDSEDQLSDIMLQQQQRISEVINKLKPLREAINPYDPTMWLSIVCLALFVRYLTKAHALYGQYRIKIMEHDSDLEQAGPAYTNVDDLIADLRK